MPEWLQTLEFKDPVFIALLALVPLTYWLATRNNGFVQFPSIDIPARAPRSLRARLMNLPGFMLAMAVACLVVAVAGPRHGDELSRIRTEGIAIMLAVDRSGSMDARDFVEGDYSVSRLDAVKQVLAGFVKGGEQTSGRPNDLIGLVAFGTYADSMSPLTLDHSNLLNVVGELGVADTQDESATAIGEGLGLAVERLRTHPAKSKVIVLLTDGVNNAGALEPMQAAELARQQGVKVYTVGAGRNGMAPIPVRTATGQTVLRPQRMEMDQETLKRIAEHTGARYFHADDAEALAGVYAEIDALERSEINEARYLEYREHYPWLVAAAIVLLLAAELLNATWLARLP